MKRVSFFLFLLVISNFAHASENLARSCDEQKVFWDSDGNSPYQNHAECVGVLKASPSGFSQQVQALTNEEAGGVGFAAFKCDNGVWTIDNKGFGGYDTMTGYCAD